MLPFSTRIDDDDDDEDDDDDNDDDVRQRRGCLSLCDLVIKFLNKSLRKKIDKNMLHSQKTQSYSFSFSTQTLAADDRSEIWTVCWTNKRFVTFRALAFLSARNFLALFSPHFPRERRIMAGKVLYESWRSKKMTSNLCNIRNKEDKMYSTLIEW